jgi:hypothetical protein
MRNIITAFYAENFKAVQESFSSIITLDEVIYPSLGSSVFYSLLLSEFINIIPQKQH